MSDTKRPDLKRLAEEASTKAVLLAGQDVAKRALGEFLHTEQAAQPDAAASKKRSRWLYLAVIVVALALAIGLIGLFLSYWQWFFLAGLLGVVSLYGYYRLRKRLKEPKSEMAVKTEKAELSRAAERPENIDLAIADQKQAREERAQAELEARAETEQAIDDELARMKAQLKK